jgi:hypothetical protein
LENVEKFIATFSLSFVQSAYLLLIPIKLLSTYEKAAYSQGILIDSEESFVPSDLNHTRIISDHLYRYTNNSITF